MACQLCPQHSRAMLAQRWVLACGGISGGRWLPVCWGDGRALGIYQLRSGAVLVLEGGCQLTTVGMCLAMAAACTRTKE